LIGSSLAASEVAGAVCAGAVTMESSALSTASGVLRFMGLVEVSFGGGDWDLGCSGGADPGGLGGDARKIMSAPDLASSATVSPVLATMRSRAWRAGSGPLTALVCTPATAAAGNRISRFACVLKRFNISAASPAGRSKSAADGSAAIAVRQRPASSKPDNINRATPRNGGGKIPMDGMG